jgi:hypothetical protein
VGYESLVEFSTSEIFFMIVSSIFIMIAYFTVGKTYAVMSFVFVVVGVAILLYGTGTQGIGCFNSGSDNLAR